MPYLEELSVYDLVQYLNQQDLKPQLAVAGAVDEISQAIEHNARAFPFLGAS